MGAYAIGILPLMKFLIEFINLNEMNAKKEAFADDFSIADSLNSIKDYWEKLIAISQKYCYFPKPTKAHLIVKEKNWWNNKTYLLTQEWISQLQEKDTSVQLSGVQNIVTNIWKI